MVREKSLKLWLVSAAAALLIPLGAQAAGLGRLIVHSTLGQPLNAEVERFRLVPVKVIAPDRDLYDTMEFQPKKIEEAIALGDKFVEDNWAELQQFLGV